MRVFVTRPDEDWIVDTVHDEFCANTRHDVVDDPENADVVWLLAPWTWSKIAHRISRKPILCTIHHEVPTKFDACRRSDFLDRDLIMTAYHVPCRQTLEFVSALTDKPVFKLGYWCNLEKWKRVMSTQDARRALGLSSRSFIVGSFQRDTEGSDLRSPKLEKGPDLFCDSIEKIVETRKDLFVLLGGWRRQYVVSRLSQAKIDFELRERVEPEVLMTMYDACDLYVVSSRFEGGPQSLLECAAARVPIVSTDVGMARDILSPHVIVNGKPSEIIYLSALAAKSDRASHAQVLDVAEFNAERLSLTKRVNDYDDLLERVSTMRA